MVAIIFFSISITPAARTWAVDDVGLCSEFLLWLAQERREWFSERYLSANWNIEESQGKRNVIINRDQLKMRMVV